MTPRVKLGDVISVAEPDYQYGTGHLILRITTIGGTRRFPDGDWLDLDGLQLRADGTQIDQRPRHVAVRTSALHVLGPRA